MVTAIKMHECKVLNFCKRSFAFLCAVGIMGYSLLTAPLFGVHATSLLEPASDKFRGYIYGIVDTLWSAIGHLNPVLGSVGSAITNLVQPVTELYVDDSSAYVLSAIANSTYFSSGRYTYKGKSNKLCSWYSYNFDSSYLSNQNSQGIYIGNVVVADDFSVSIHVQPDSDWQFVNGEDYIRVFTSYTNDRWVMYRFDCYDVSESTTLPTKRPLRICVTVTGYDSSGKPVVLGFKECVYNLTTVSLRFSFETNTNNSVIIPTNIINNFILRDPNIVTSSSPAMETIIGNRIDNSTKNISNVLPNIPENYTFNDFDSRVNFYNDYITHYVQKNFVDYPEIVNQYIYYDVENPPTETTETTPTETIDPSQPSTGNGTVVIIDPFTLPPEWLEDDAELDTDHYILDSEQWESPMETIARYKSQVSAASIEDEEPWLDDGKLVAPLDVTQAMESFQYFAIDLLDRSGILVVVASCLAFGLVIRIISLK